VTGSRQLAIGVAAVAFAVLVFFMFVWLPR
jgi:hypothetical protein